MMNNRQLGELLRTLPRRSASPALESEVRRRIHKPPMRQRKPLLWRLTAAATVAVCVAAVLQLGWMQVTHRRQVAAMRAEQQRLAAELDAVKKSAAASEPVVVLDNGSGTRVIVDLDTVRPTSSRTFD